MANKINSIARNPKSTKSTARIISLFKKQIIHVEKLHGALTLLKSSDIFIDPTTTEHVRIRIAFHLNNALLLLSVIKNRDTSRFKSFRDTCIKFVNLKIMMEKKLYNV